MLASGVWGWKQLPLHTHDVDREWFALNSQNKRGWTYFKKSIFVHYYSCRHLETRSARRLASCLLPAFLCAHVLKRDVWVRGSDSVFWCPCFDVWTVYWAPSSKPARPAVEWNYVGFLLFWSQFVISEKQRLPWYTRFTLHFSHSILFSFIQF